MADITLHSGSFCDRNNNEISITFFKRTSTPVMTVNPTALSFTSNGGTKQLRVSNYTGTLSISVTGGTGWLSRTQSTSSGVRTYTFTATANTATTMRNATITLTDSNSTVTVGVTQAGAVSNVTVNPNYLVFNQNGETKTTTVTWTGGSTPTWSNVPSWATVRSTKVGGELTLTIIVGANTEQTKRTGTIYVTNGISTADLAIEQDAVHTVTVQPSSFTFPASGGTQVLTISDIQGSFSMNYEGDGLSVILLDYPSSTSRRYNVTYTPNTVTATRTGVINVSDTAGGWVAVTTTQAANTDTFAVSPTSFQYGGTGSTNTFTFTGVPAAGLSYDIPSGVDWVTVSNLSNSSVDITTAANQSPTSRTTTVKFYDMDDIDNYVTVTVNQDAGQSSLSVSPSSITYLPRGGTSGITATWTAGTEPTATITYVQGDPGWMTPTGSGTVTGNTKSWAWTASSNYDSSSRTALITVTNGLQSEYVTVSQSSAPSPVVFSVTPSTVQASASGQATQVTITGAPSNMSYDVTYGSGTDWTHISNFSQTGATLVISANTTASQRTATVKFYDQDNMDNYVTVTITQDAAAVPALSVMTSSMSFVAAGESKSTTVENIVGVLTHTEPSWITLGMSGSGGSRTVSVTAASNSLSTSRSGSVTFDDDRQSPVSMAVSQAGSSRYTVTPSDVTLNWGYDYQYRSDDAQNHVKITGLTSRMTIPHAVITYGGEPGSPEDWLTTANGVISSTTYETNLVLSSKYMRIERGTWTATVDWYSDNIYLGTTRVVRDGTLPETYVSPSSVMFTTLSGSHGLTLMTPHNLPEASTTESWLSVSARTNDAPLYYFTVYASGNSGPFRSGLVDFKAYVSILDPPESVATATIKQRGVVMSVTPSSLDFTDTEQTLSLAVSNVNPNGFDFTTNASWLSGTVGTYDISLTAASNLTSSSRSANVIIYDVNDSVVNRLSVPVTQASHSVSSISVTPSRVDLSYGNDSETLTISGVPSGGYSTSLSYNTGASGWLNLVSTAYNIIVTASRTTYPSSRTATLTVTNASVPSDSVAIPITQAGNPQVLSVTPNAWTYSSALGTHTFTVIYNASGTITTSVEYFREEGDEELDWLEVELVDHEEGSETWEYSIDVGPNPGAVREAVVTFTGDGGGADEVQVTQQAGN
jgi:hypothetical protein